MTNFLDNIFRQLKKEEDIFFSDLIATGDFFEFSFPTSSRSAWQIESLSSLSNNSKIFKLIRENFSKVSDANHMPDVDLCDIVCELYRSAKLTDFISGGIGTNSSDIILSKKVRTLMEGLNLGHHKFYQLNISHLNKIQSDYFYFKFFNNASAFVDYGKSTFYSQNGVLNYSSRQIIQINSSEDLKLKSDDFRKKDIQIMPKEIYLTSDFPNFDIFTFHDHFILSVFISKKFSRILNDNNISGTISSPTRQVKTGTNSG